MKLVIDTENETLEVDGVRLTFELLRALVCAPGTPRDTWYSFERRGESVTVYARPALIDCGYSLDDYLGRD